MSRNAIARHLVSEVVGINELNETADIDFLVACRDGERPEGFPADCLPITVPTPQRHVEAYGACEVDPQHAAVFGLGEQTIAQVCRSHGLKAWGS